MFYCVLFLFLSKIDVSYKTYKNVAQSASSMAKARSKGERAMDPPSRGESEMEREERAVRWLEVELVLT